MHLTHEVAVVSTEVSEELHFVWFEKVVKIFRTSFSTLYASMCQKLLRLDWVVCAGLTGSASRVKTRLGSVLG